MGSITAYNIISPHICKLSIMLFVGKLNAYKMPFRLLLYLWWCVDSSQHSESYDLSVYSLSDCYFVEISIVTWLLTSTLLPQSTRLFLQSDDFFRLFALLL